MQTSRRIALGAALATSIASMPAGAVLTSAWSSSPSSAAGFTQNQLEVISTLDWISTQLLVELGGGEIHYVTPGVVPALDPTLLVGAAANTSLSYPAGGNPSDPLNSQIPGFGAIPNVGTGGAGGLGGSLTPVVSLTTFDLTYFGDPADQLDIAFPNFAPLVLAQMTVSNNAHGTWAIRVRNSAPSDPNNQPGDVLLANGFILNGTFFNGQIPGDTDNDGDIDDTDLGTAISNFTGPIGGAGGKTLAEGDTDGDGDIDDTDLGIMISGFSGPLAPSPATVPEPASLAILAFGSLALCRRR